MVVVDFEESLVCDAESAELGADYSVPEVALEGKNRVDGRV